MTVKNETARWYQYIDITTQAEALFEVTTKTIDEELAAMEQAVRNGYSRPRKY